MTTHSSVARLDSESPRPRLEPVPTPSHELLARAHAGWARFIASVPEPSDD